MKKYATLWFLLLIASACQQGNGTSHQETDFENKPFQQVFVGDTVPIYYTTNACCQTCFDKNKATNAIQLVDRKVVVLSDPDCSGCSNLEALYFVAQHEGKDTLVVGSAAASRSCQDSTLWAGWPTYVVEVLARPK